MGPQWQYNPLVIPLGISTLVILALIVLAARQRRNPVAAPALGFLACLLIWIVTSLLELVALNLRLSLLFADLSFIGIAFFPVAWLGIVMVYNGKEARFRRLLPWLLVIPVLTNIVIWTNPLHHLWRGDSYRDLTTTWFPISVYDYGPWFYAVHAPYSYALTIIAMILLVRSLFSQARAYRAQLLILLIAFLLPLIMDMIYLLGFLGYSPILRYILAPVTFTISGLLVGWTLLGFRFLDLTPIARDLVLENMQDLVIVLDDQGRVVDLNPAARRHLFRGNGDIIGQALGDLLPDQDDLIGQSRRGGSHLREEMTVRTNVEHRVYEMRSSPIARRSGRSAGMLLIMRDISGDREREDQLQVLSRAIESSSVSVVITDPQGQIEYVNPVFTRVTGYSAEEALGQNPRILKSGHTPPEVYQELWQTLTAGREWRGEFINKKKNGELFREEAVISPVKNSMGNITHFVAVKENITERRQAEKIVELRLRLFEYAAGHSLDELMQKALDEIGELTGSLIGFYHFVEEDQKTLTLQAWSTRTREEYCQAEGQGLHYPIDEAGVWVDGVRERKPVIHNDYASLPHRKGMPEGHAELVRELVVPTLRDDRIVSILGVGNKVSDYNEKDIELVAYVADIVWNIVERKRAEELLRQVNDELRSRNEELDAFGHTVAHDIKNPLGIIIAYADMLADRDPPLSEEDAHEGARTIVKMGLKMDNIIEELMLLSGLRTADLKMEPLDMGQILAETRARLAYLIEESQAEIVSPASWPEALGYAPWVEEVWVNYISNAIKYGGEPPRIELGATAAGDALRFWVRDNGAGLTPEEQMRLFAPFERLGQSRAQGHGLGLSIVRRIVERMGGQVSVESTRAAGEGSTFSFVLPAAG